MVTTREPRLRFVRNDTTVAEIWETDSGELGFYNPETDDYFVLGNNAVDFTDLDITTEGSITTTTLSADSIDINQFLGKLESALNLGGNDIQEVANITAQHVIATSVNVDEVSTSEISDFTATGDINLFANNLIDDSSGTVIDIWDAVNQHIPQSSLQNDSVTVSAGSGLTGGGSVSLGESTSLELVTDSVTVNAGSGLTGGGTFSLGGSTTLSLTNDSVTVTAGDGLTGGGNVSLGGSTTLDHDGTADTIDGYDIQKNGTDGTGIINLKTQ